MGTQCLFAYQTENNFWTDRRQALRRAPSALYASLPLDLAPLRSPSVFAAQTNSLNLSSSVAQTVPRSFMKDYAQTLGALSPVHGTIRKVTLPKSHSVSGPVVIHIQDVHMNQEAQWNIRETVQSLLRAGQVNLVALEGATETIDLQAFVDYPDAKAGEMAADHLLKENKISGPIHAVLTAKQKLPRILGVDDPAHYQANIRAYQVSASKMGETKVLVNALRQEIEHEKAAIFSPALQRLDQMVQSYRDGHTSLGEYVQGLVANISRSGSHVLDDAIVSVPTGRPQGKSGVRQFLEALEMERRLDFKKVESERARLIERLTQTLTAQETQTLMDQSLAYRSGHVRYADFYYQLKALCKKKGIHLTSFPFLDSYVRYVLLADGIDIERLLTEISSLEKAAYARLATTPEERSLAARSRSAWLTGKLVDFALTPAEWEEYGSGTRAIDQHTLTSFENFYKEARARDIAMARNLFQGMKDVSSPTESEESPVTVLVTGGFHAQGMTHLLTRQGATVVSYVPKMEKVDTAQGATSLSVFTAEKSPLEKLFAGEKLFLAASPFSDYSKRFLVFWRWAQEKWVGHGGVSPDAEQRLRTLMSDPPNAVNSLFFRDGALYLRLEAREVRVFSENGIPHFSFMGNLTDLKKISTRQAIQSIVLEFPKFILARWPKIFSRFVFLDHRTRNSSFEILSLRLLGMQRVARTTEYGLAVGLLLWLFLDWWYFPLAWFGIYAFAHAVQIVLTPNAPAMSDHEYLNNPIQSLDIKLKNSGLGFIKATQGLVNFLQSKTPGESTVFQFIRFLTRKGYGQQLSGFFTLRRTSMPLLNGDDVEPLWKQYTEDKTHFFDQTPLDRIFQLRANPGGSGVSRSVSKEIPDAWKIFVISWMNELKASNHSDQYDAHWKFLQDVTTHILAFQPKGPDRYFSEIEEMLSQVAEDRDLTEIVNEMSQVNQNILSLRLGLARLIKREKGPLRTDYQADKEERLVSLFWFYCDKNGENFLDLPLKFEEVIDEHVDRIIELTNTEYLRLFNAIARATAPDEANPNDVFDRLGNLIETAQIKPREDPQSLQVAAALGLVEMGGALEIICDRSQVLGILKIGQDHGLESKHTTYGAQSVVTFLFPTRGTATASATEVTAVLQDVQDQKLQRLSVKHKITIGGNFPEDIKYIALIHWLTGRFLVNPLEVAHSVLSDAPGIVISGINVDQPELSSPQGSRREGTEIRGRVIVPIGVSPEELAADLYSDLTSVQFLATALTKTLIPAESQEPWEKQLADLFEKFKNEAIQNIKYIDPTSAQLLGAGPWLDTHGNNKWNEIISPVLVSLSSKLNSVEEKKLQNVSWNHLVTMKHRYSSQIRAVIITKNVIAKARTNQARTPSTLSQFWRLFSDYGPLDHILRLAKWESAPFAMGMGFAVGAHFLVGASLGWALGIALLAAAVGGAHWFGTYGMVGGKLQEVFGENSLGKSLSWFLWTAGFGVSLFLLGSALPREIAAFAMFIYTWIGTYIGVKDHEKTNREWVVSNIPGLNESQRSIARGILKNLDGRPLSLDMNQMRELVMETAENYAQRNDSGVIDLSLPSGFSFAGIKLMFVRRASLTNKGLANLKALMARDQNVFVLSDRPVPGVLLDRTVVVPFGTLSERPKENNPFQEIVLTEVRSVLDRLAPDHPLRLRSSDPVGLYHTPDLQLNGKGLHSTDSLAEALKNPRVLLLESWRAFPFLNEAWQDSLKTLRALAEFA
jgi:hypothetical protein